MQKINPHCCVVLWVDNNKIIYWNFILNLMDILENGLKNIKAQSLKIVFVGLPTLELIKIHQHTIVMRVMWCNLSNGIQWCFYCGIENYIKVYTKVWQSLPRIFKAFFFGLFEINLMPWISCRKKRFSYRKVLD